MFSHSSFFPLTFTPKVFPEVLSVLILLGSCGTDMLQGFNLYILNQNATLSILPCCCFFLCLCMSKEQVKNSHFPFPMNHMF